MTEFHVATALFERIGKYGDQTAIRYRQNDVWREISWNGLGEQVRAAAKEPSFAAMEEDLIKLFKKTGAWA